MYGAEPRTSETDSAPTTGRNTRLSRRNYVRSLAAVATATTAFGATGTVAGQDDYEVIEAANQTITIDSGETWENKLIDMTTGQDVVITAHGSDWTVRNVGFRGENTSGTGSATFGISDAGGSSTIENVYLGDGSDSRNGSSSGHGQTAFWVDPDHAGHVDFENVNIQGFADNAIYASAPGNAGGGTVHIDSSFAANCYVSHFRLATEEQGDQLLCLRRRRRVPGPWYLGLGARHRRSRELSTRDERTERRDRRRCERAGNDGCGP